MQTPEPQKEHHWLRRLVGEWTFEHECRMGPDQPPMKSTGRQTVRALGELWIVIDIEGTAPDGQVVRSIIQLGYDSKKQKFVGSFIASCMDMLWPYCGTLDAAEKVLTLDSEGPSFSGEGTAQYQDIIGLIDDDHHTFSSQCQGPDGQWVQFMHGHYHRVRA